MLYILETCDFWYKLLSSPFSSRSWSSTERRDEKDKKQKQTNKQTNKKHYSSWPGLGRQHTNPELLRARAHSHMSSWARGAVAAPIHVAITSPQGGTDDRESPAYTFVLAGEWDQLCYRLPALVAHVSSYLATLIVLLESKLLDVTCGQFTRTVDQKVQVWSPLYCIPVFIYPCLPCEISFETARALR